MNRHFLRLAALLSSLALTSLAAGCTTSTVTNEAEEPEPPATADLPATDAPEAPAEAPAAVEAPAGDESKEGKKAIEVSGPGAGTAKADGESCDAATECSSGVCEGEGCGAGQGKCMAKNRMCTRDLRPYCGCDGKTFESSGSCPGARFSKKGPCDGDAALPKVPKP